MYDWITLLCTGNIVSQLYVNKIKKKRLLYGYKPGTMPCTGENMKETRDPRPQRAFTLFGETKQTQGTIKYLRWDTNSQCQGSSSREERGRGGASGGDLREEEGFPRTWGKARWGSDRRHGRSQAERAERLPTERSLGWRRREVMLGTSETNPERRGASENRSPRRSRK